MSELARLVDVFASGQHTIYDRICERLTPVSLIRMRRVSRTTYQAVQDFSYRAFDVNRRLSRFFSDPFAFRSLQARTATLISGSFALQFFDRTFYPEADLDLVAAVYTFVRPSDDNESQKVKLQVIVPTVSPFECVITFHSTCVMNAISYNAAYSLYPYATFEQRQSLATNPKDRKRAAFRKYAARGWKILSSLSPLLVPSALSDRFFVDQSRGVVDKHSWVMPLNTDGVTGPEPLSPSSTPLTWDPVAECSWVLRSIRGEILEAHMTYFITSSRILKYRYTAADEDCDIYDGYRGMLIRFLTSQERLETRKLHSTGEQPGGEIWTWYVPISRHLRMTH
ncbi:hypothetical protein WOLCODRAFT_91093 [Wolfiporia cocos MD-104 SS10]|uniref:F-box domain-containing protein n=1 Tax=Wolfiporia cocos (strain MD-104) TaxID=742152 RepID=A0A2H3K488_WOLCO|nr:hypothetical protein WOLCODRAFT_91093 [Wolfiporia cocos MD-104 SS10]